MKRNNHHWLIAGRDGVTPLHDAASNGHLDRVPKELLQPKALLNTNNNGNNAIHCAAQSGHLDQIPTHVLTGLSSMQAQIAIVKRTMGLAGEVFEGENDEYGIGINLPEFAGNAKRFIQRIPTLLGNIIVSSNMLLPNKKGVTPLHLAAKNANLDQVPVELLTKANMNAADSFGTTVLQEAFRGQGCYQLAQELISQETVQKRDANGDTALHIAAERGTLDGVPTELLSEENMLAPNHAGITPLHKAAYFGHMAKVPKKLLTVENLLTIDHSGNTPLHKMADKSNESQMDYILGIDFPDSVKKIVGDKWWNANEEVKLAMQKSKQPVQDEESGVDIF